MCGLLMFPAIYIASSIFHYKILLFNISVTHGLINSICLLCFQYIKTKNEIFIKLNWWSNGSRIKSTQLFLSHYTPINFHYLKINISVALAEFFSWIKYSGYSQRNFEILWNNVLYMNITKVIFSFFFFSHFLRLIFCIQSDIL